MFGFIVGTASLFGLIYVLRRHRWYGHGWSRRGRWGSEGRRSWMLNWLYRHLDTTPGQEKVFTTAAEDLDGRFREMRGELEQVRKEIARALRMPQFEATAIRESFARERAHLETLEESVLGHLEKIHQALDERQRGILAEMVQDGPRGFARSCGYGSYRNYRRRDDERAAFRTA